MKRPLLPERRCISHPCRVMLSLLLLLLLLLLVYQASAKSSSPAVLSGLNPLLSSSRNPLAQKFPGGGLPKGLVTELFLGQAVPMQLAESNQQHNQVLLSSRLDRKQHGDGLLHQLSWAAAQRQKRHAAGRLHNAQLMRVGCALGTCQVQNLSYRLWQLKGQSGRHDLSPVNPNSPHSYG